MLGLTSKKKSRNVLKSRQVVRWFHLRNVKLSSTKAEHIKRTWDYEPFFREFMTELHNQGQLNPLLGLDENGRKIKQMKMQRTN